MHLRPLTTADLPAVVELERQCFPNPWPLSAFRRELADVATSYYTVTIDEGRLVGYLGARVIQDEAHITTLGVDPGCRGRGLAKHLLLDLIDHGLSRGVVRLTLEVRDSNWAARKLYETLGFIDIALRRKYYQDPVEDAVIMWVHDLRAPEVHAAIEQVRAGMQPAGSGEW